MDSMKEVYDGIKRLITISERIEEHTKNIAEIKDKAGKNTEDITEIKGKVGAIAVLLDSMDTELISLKRGQKEMGTDIRTIKKPPSRSYLYALISIYIQLVKGKNDNRRRSDKEFTRTFERAS